VKDFTERTFRNHIEAGEIREIKAWKQQPGIYK
jgi:hypothetical protein